MAIQLPHDAMASIAMSSLPSQRRRKITTYGKGARKPLFDFANDVTSAETKEGGKLVPIKRCWKTGGQLSYKTASSSRGTSRESSKDPEASSGEGICFPSRAIKEPGKLAPLNQSRKTGRTPLRGHTLSSPDTSRASSNDPEASSGTDIYKVPLSDDELPQLKRLGLNKGDSRASSPPLHSGSRRDIYDVPSSDDEKPSSKVLGLKKGRLAQKQLLETSTKTDTRGPQSSREQPPPKRKPGVGRGRAHPECPLEVRSARNIYDPPSSNDGLLTRRRGINRSRPPSVPPVEVSPQKDIYDVPSSDNEMPPSRRLAMNKGRLSARMPPKQSTGKNAQGKLHSSATDPSSMAGLANPKKRKTSPMGLEAAARKNKLGDTLGGQESKRAKLLVSDTPKTTVSQSMTATKQPAKRRTDMEIVQRTRAAKPFAKPNLPKGQSAPAVLDRMLLLEEEVPGSSPSVMQDRSGTPPMLGLEEVFGNQTDLTTPRNRRAGTPSGGFGAGSATPRQADLWNKLLGNKPVPFTPSIMRIADLHISQSPPLRRAQTDMSFANQSRRPKLVDSLVQSVPILEDEPSELETSPDIDDEGTSRLVPPDVAPEGVSSDMDIDQPATLMGQNSQFSQHSAQGGILPNAGLKRTYARERSYLKEESIDELLLAPLEIPAEGATKFPQRLGIAGFGAKHGPFSDEEDDDNVGPMRSRHELRLAGERTKVKEDLENLLYDTLDHGKKALSRRRSAMMELCTKLLDIDFIKHLSEYGFDGELFSKSQRTTDVVTGFTIAVAIALAIGADPPPIIYQNLLDNDAFSILIFLLDFDDDIKCIAKDRRTNMARVAQHSLSEFRDRILASSVWVDSKPESLSPRTMALRAMDLLIRKLRERGNMDCFLDGDSVSRLVTFAYDASSAPVDMHQLDQIISILESGSVASTVAGSKSGWTASSLKLLVSILPTYLGATEKCSQRIEILALRLTLNLTNNDPTACEVFAKPPLVQPLVRSIIKRFASLQARTSGDLEAIRDCLLVSIGVLINLVELSDSARQAVLSNTDEPLVALITVFLAGYERASQVIAQFISEYLRTSNSEQVELIEEMQVNIPYGYLSVLLVNLCMNDVIKEKVRNMLPDRRLDTLVRAFEEFIYYHQKVDMDACLDDDGSDARANFTRRLQAMIRRLK